MRITGGALKGRRIDAPDGLATRPTASLVREALFQILTFKLNQPWEETSVLDLFAGAGSLGIEALSRGARHVQFVEKNRVAAGILKKNLHMCRFEENSDIFLAELGAKAPSTLRWLQRTLNPAHLILADPPYNTHLSSWTLTWTIEQRKLCSGGVMVIEESNAAKLPESLASLPCNEHGDVDELRLFDFRSYGQTTLWFYVLNQVKGRSNRSEVLRYL